MFRIRIHGRGGQGVKTASRILGTAFFIEGFEVQDAPRYGAERRGAPIFAYVRASREPIFERGIIDRPDLVVVADDSLVALPAAGVLQGVGSRTVFVIVSREAESVWQSRLNTQARILVLPRVPDVGDQIAPPDLGVVCAGAAARLVGVISTQKLENAIREELGGLGKTLLEENVAQSLHAFAQFENHIGVVSEGCYVRAQPYQSPDWIQLPFDDARTSAPTIHASATSVEVKTGLWRSLRPVIDYDRCNRCWWVCSEFCPDSAILVDDDGKPHIDYDHCKGCMICVAQCPPHAIRAIAETRAQGNEAQGGVL